MLKRKNRLKGRKNFELVLREGKTFFSKNLVLKILPIETNEIKFGFIVSKKISKKATKRNKIKRWLREIVREEIKNLKGGFWGILLAKKEILETDFWKLKEEVKKTFEKAKLYG